MRACYVRQTGSLEEVRVGDLPPPMPGRGEALVRVKAAALNHLDLWVVKGRVRPDGAHVLGADGAGVVAAVGEGVTSLSVGDEVVIDPGLPCGTCDRCLAGETSVCETFGLLGVARPGTFAESVTVPAANLAPRPAHLSWEEAAALTLAHLTAWRMLVTRARLRAGETVLVHGIGGGVALAGLQLARFMGARAIVTSASSQKLARAKALGAAAGIDYRAEDVGKRARELNGGRGVDVVLDTVGAATLAGSLAAVRRGGRIVTCGVTGGNVAELPLRELYWNQVELLGSTMGSRGELRDLLRVVTAAEMRPVIHSVRPLAEARDALATMERAEQLGKIVLRIAA